MSQKAHRERRQWQVGLIRKILEAEHEAETAVAAFGSEAGANEPDKETTVLTRNEISNAIPESTQMSHLKRWRRSGKAGRAAAQTKTPTSARDREATKDDRDAEGKAVKANPERVANEQPTSFGLKK